MGGGLGYNRYFSRTFTGRGSIVNGRYAIVALVVPGFDRLTAVFGRFSGQRRERNANGVELMGYRQAHGDGEQIENVRVDDPDETERDLDGVENGEISVVDRVRHREVQVEHAQVVREPLAVRARQHQVAFAVNVRRHRVQEQYHKAHQHVTTGDQQRSGPGPPETRRPATGADREVFAGHPQALPDLLGPPDHYPHLVQRAQDVRGVAQLRDAVRLAAHPIVDPCHGQHQHNRFEQQHDRRRRPVNVVPQHVPVLGVQNLMQSDQFR